MKYFLGMILGTLITVSSVFIYNSHNKNTSLEQDISKIKFAVEWQNINRSYKFTEEIKPNTNMDINQFVMNVNKENGLKIKDIYMEWIFQGKKENQYRQLDIDVKQNGYNTSVNSVTNNESDLYKVSVENFMSILDEVNLSERLGKITTRCDYYKVEIRGLQKAKSEILERKAEGDLISEETDKSTGETIKKYYKHQFVVFHDKTSEVISFGKTYTTKTDALDMTITPMVKMKSGEYQGTPEVEIIYELKGQTSAK